MSARPPRPTLRVRVAPSAGVSYPILIGSGILRRLPAVLDTFAPAHLYFLITDSRVARLYARALHRVLRHGRRRIHLLVVPAGERSKTRAMKSRLEDRMLALGGGRDSAVIALGGGMIGDLAGFAAATFQRGIPHIAVPTTLLAMVDASIGGKTAVDHPRGKNLIGAFHHPRAVLCDTNLLRSLPEREYRSGLAEVVKTAVVGDAALFRLLERSSAAILSRHPGAVQDLVKACCRVKASVVGEDERESGRRAILNFGHTLGHALEHLSGYRISHGEAVSIGMVMEARAAEKAGILMRGEAGRIEAVLQRFGLPVSAPERFSPARILAAAGADKKSRRGEIRYALPLRIGRMAAGSGRFTLPLPARAIEAAFAR